MCALVKWSNQTIDGSLFLFQKTMWNGIHSKKEHIPERRNHMSWTHQSSHLLESHHSLKHQPWRSCFSSFSSSHTSFCSVLRICFVFSLNMRVFIYLQNSYFCIHFVFISWICIETHVTIFLIVNQICTIYTSTCTVRSLVTVTISFL